MAKGYQKAKGRSAGRFVLLRHDMMQSPAWLSLSANARCIWLEIMHRYNSNNNGQIPLACREAALLCRISKNTAAKAFKELQETGFIKVGIPSSFDYKKKQATRWIVTHELYNGQSPTNDWRKWVSKVD